MAFEQDGCSICTQAKEELEHIKTKLKCLHKDKFALNYLKQECKNYPPVSDPIIFQVCSIITIIGITYWFSLSLLLKVGGVW